VIYPALAYPTYDIGARLAGARSVPSDVLDGGPGAARLRWVNSPSNPTGRVLSAARLRDAVRWARDRGCVLASDECYLELGWSVDPVTVLHPSVRGESLDGVLAVFSLSKRSNLAGYRAGFVTGDPALISQLLLVRRQAGMIVPGPVQAAMTAALSDDAHAAEQKARYGARREILAAGLTAAGFRIDHSEAGLYLWAARQGLDCWAACELLAAECGVLVGPGSMYGAAGAGHIRVALTAADERVAAAGQRLHALAS
jgi:succinyldiaminopimelate transaminase